MRFSGVSEEDRPTTVQGLLASIFGQSQGSCGQGNLDIYITNPCRCTMLYINDIELELY